MKKFISIVLTAMIVLSLFVAVPAYATIPIEYAKGTVLEVKVTMDSVDEDISAIQGTLSYVPQLQYVEDSFSAPHFPDMCKNIISDESYYTFRFNTTNVDNFYNIKSDHIVCSMKFTAVDDVPAEPFIATINDIYRVEDVTFVDIDKTCAVSISVLYDPIQPTTEEPTTAEPTTEAPTTAEPTTVEPTTDAPTTAEPTTAEPTTDAPTTAEPTTAEPTTDAPTTAEQTTAEPTTAAPTTAEPTTAEPTTAAPTTAEPTTAEPTTVAPTTAEPTTKPAVKTPSLTFTKKSAQAGATFTLSVKNKGTNKVTFSTSNAKIAKVNSNGVITTLQRGAVTIKVKVGTKTLSCKVTVTNSPVIKDGKKYLSSKYYTVKKGKTISFKIYRKASAINNVYKTSNKKIAKITSKANATKLVIKGLKKGKATLTVKVNGVKSFNINVNVK